MLNKHFINRPNVQKMMYKTILFNSGDIHALLNLSTFCKQIIVSNQNDNIVS